MGKKLIIKGADFSVNAIDLINWTDITNQITYNTVGYRQYLHYPNNNLSDAYMYYAQNDPNLKLALVDVSSYVGKRLKLHTNDKGKASNYQGGAYWMAFASSVTSLPWTTTTNLQNAIVAVERISGKGTGSNNMVDFILTVPVGATHLVFSTKNQSQTTLGVEL